MTVIGKCKKREGICLSVIFLTENATGPALAVFAFSFGKTHTSLRASNPKITLNLKDGIWPQVALLTCGARGPASPSSPFVYATHKLKLGYGCGFQIPTRLKAV